MKIVERTIWANNEGEEFIRRQHPDTRTARVWVKAMNKRWGTYWGIRKRDRTKED